MFGFEKTEKVEVEKNDYFKVQPTVYFNQSTEKDLTDVVFYNEDFYKVVDKREKKDITTFKLKKMTEEEKENYPKLRVVNNIDGLINSAKNTRTAVKEEREAAKENKKNKGKFK